MYMGEKTRGGGCIEVVVFGSFVDSTMGGEKGWGGAREVCGCEDYWKFVSY